MLWIMLYIALAIFTEVRPFEWAENKIVFWIIFVFIVSISPKYFAESD